MYKLTLQFGGYTHVTFLRLGKIAENNLKNRNCEFSLRPNPNAKKNFQILQIMGCTLTIRGWIPSRKSLTNTQLFWVSHYFWWGATISLDPLLTKMGRPLPHLSWSGLLWTSGSCWLILTGKRRVWGQTQEPLLCGSSDRFYFATQISKFTSHYTVCVCKYLTGCNCLACTTFGRKTIPWEAAFCLLFVCVVWTILRWFKWHCPPK